MLNNNRKPAFNFTLQISVVRVDFLLLILILPHPHLECVFTIFANFVHVGVAVKKKLYKIKSFGNEIKQQQQK